MKSVPIESASGYTGYFRQRLDELKEKYPVIGDVRHMGLMRAVELVKK